MWLSYPKVYKIFLTVYRFLTLFTPKLKIELSQVEEGRTIMSSMIVHENNLLIGSYTPQEIGVGTV